MQELDFRIDNSGQPKLMFQFWPDMPLGRKIILAGEALTAKVREQISVSGHYQAARNLRKQGFSLKVSLAIVAGRFL